MEIGRLQMLVFSYLSILFSCAMHTRPRDKLSRLDVVVGPDFQAKDFGCIALD